jgi:predicted nucleic acid-binding protein
VSPPSTERGLVDTSAVIGLEGVEVDRLPLEVLVSSLTLAELSAGPSAAEDAAERARRLDRLQRVESTFETVPFDGRCARAFGRVYAAVAARGRKPRGPRAIDLLIAATALAHDLPIFTLDPGDLSGLADLIEVVDLGSQYS